MEANSMSLFHALFLQSNLATVLSQFARTAEARTQAIIAPSAHDTVSTPHAGACAHLQWG
ncbi:hypothetical protein EUX98_g3600 [Antrodiella citrinella]|uniref:Uncharacterized protein n=1 Tax=Antrodiella citrinella TaxID=2447956 RepID=A0A4S4MW59_9APHY|nr:hypothetical protein EUX98_g3600 [Antrodiella citrinella]